MLAQVKQGRSVGSQVALGILGLCCWTVQQSNTSGFCPLGIPILASQVDGVRSFGSSLVNFQTIQDVEVLSIAFIGRAATRGGASCESQGEQRSESRPGSNSCAHTPLTVS